MNNCNHLILIRRPASKQSHAQRRLRILGLAHLKEGKSYVAVARSLRVTRHAVMRWAGWFTTDGIERLSGIAQSAPRQNCRTLTNVSLLPLPTESPELNPAVQGLAATASPAFGQPML